MKRPQKPIFCAGKSGCNASMAFPAKLFALCLTGSTFLFEGPKSMRVVGAVLALTCSRRLFLYADPPIMEDGPKVTSLPPTFVFVGALPPPVHGQSTVNRAVLDAVEAKCRTVVIDLSPGSLRRSGLYYLRRLTLAVAGIFAILRHSSDSKVRIIYLSVDSGLGILLNIAFAGVGRACGYGLFLHHHSYAYLVGRSAAMALLAGAAGRGARHVFLCGDMRARYEALYGVTAHPLICSNGHFAPAPRPKTTPFCGDGEAIRIGLLSNLCAEKGLYDFLRILDYPENIQPVVKGVLAGPPVSARDSDEIEKAQRRIGTRLAFLGPVYGEAKDDFFDRIDVFVFPTRYATKSYPLVIVEALARGIPVIAYGRGCIATYLTEPAGIVVAPAQDFAEVAFPILVQWRRDELAYRRAAEAATKLSLSLREESEKSFHDLSMALIDPGFTLN